MIATVAEVGNPSVSNGTSTPPKAALLRRLGSGDSLDRPLTELLGSTSTVDFSTP